MDIVPATSPEDRSNRAEEHRVVYRSTCKDCDQTFIGNNGRTASTRAKERASSGTVASTCRLRRHVEARIDSLLVHAVTLTLLVRKFVVAICKQDLSIHLQSPKRKHLCRFVVTEQFHAGTPPCDSHPTPVFALLISFCAPPSALLLYSGLKLARPLSLTSSLSPAC